MEFESEEAAKKALEATDQMKIGEETISVAISAPPPKKTNSNDKINEPIRHARSRLQVPLVPRALQVKKGESTSKSAGSSNSTAKDTGSSSNGTSKSNADFRKMLLK